MLSNKRALQVSEPLIRRFYNEFFYGKNKLEKAKSELNYLT